MPVVKHFAWLRAVGKRTFDVVVVAAVADVVGKQWVSLSVHRWNYFGLYELFPSCCYCHHKQ